MIEDMYAPYLANRTASAQAFANTEIAAKKGLDHLGATMLFALGAVLSAVAMGAETLGLRGIRLIVVGGVPLRSGHPSNLLGVRLTEDEPA